MEWPLGAAVGDIGCARTSRGARCVRRLLPVHLGRASRLGRVPGGHAAPGQEPPSADDRPMGPDRDGRFPRSAHRRVTKMNSMARRMFELVEPIGVIPYSADEPNEAMFALGFTNYWDTY